MLSINIALVVALVALTLLTFYKGARLLLTAIITFYPASVIYAAIPNKTNYLFLGTKGVSLFYSHALIYAVVFLLIFFVLRHTTQHEGLGYGLSQWFNAALIAGSFILVLLAITLHVLPAYDVFELSTKVQNFWSSNTGYLLSIIVPLIAIWRVARY